MHRSPWPAWLDSCECRWTSCGDQGPDVRSIHGAPLVADRHGEWIVVHDRLVPVLEGELDEADGAADEVLQLVGELHASRCPPGCVKQVIGPDDQQVDVGVGG